MTLQPAAGLRDRYKLAIALLLMVTIAAGAVLLQGGVEPAQVGRAYALAVGAIGLYYLVVDLRELSTERFRRGARRPEAVGTRLPGDLVGLQDTLRASRVSRTHLELAVKPLLREIAADRLLLVGVSLSRDPQTAAALMGPQLSQAIQEQPPSPDVAPHRAPQARELMALIDVLEGIGR